MSKNTPTTPKKTRNSPKFSTTTRIIHAGRDPFAYDGFVNTPIWRGSTVLYPTLEHINQRKARYSYGTKGSPTLSSLEDAWTQLSQAAGTVLVPSGLAAISLALFACLKSGDHLLMCDSVYRPTRHFCDTMLKKFGIETTYYDPLIGAGIEALMRPNTRAIFTESPGSQSFEIQDIPAIAQVAHAHDAVVLLDNTWATPLLFPPHERGVDIAIEAGTKYLSGHSDLLLGLVSANEAWWPRVRDAFDTLAMCAGPEDVFLALRGLRTMPLRLFEQGKRALVMAHWLKKRPEVAQVLHPALPECPGHDLWKRDFLGSSGLFSIILKPAPPEAVAAMLDHLDLFKMGFSWGGFESLIIPFDCSTYRTATRWKTEGPALRLQIGLEDVRDLKADLARGFRRVHGAAQK